MTIRTKILKWALTLILCSVVTGVLVLLHFPAALLVGPMIAGIIMGLNGVELSIPRFTFSLSQGFLGCVTAAVLTHEVLYDVISHWQLTVIITVSTIIFSLLVSAIMARFSSLPGTTSVWGIMPGGASAMVAICSDYGADMRLVALIQYLRVLLVVLFLAVLSHFMADVNTTQIIHSINWFPIPSINLLYTTGIVLIGLLITHILKFPSGRIILPMVLGALLQNLGYLRIETPQWLLALSFGVIGLTVGLRFNFAVIKLAFKTLPIILFSILLMMVFGCGQAVLIHEVMGIDYLSCFLATSPGGLDTSVIIALDTHSDFAIILPLQIIRLFSVLLFGPMIARYLSKKILSSSN